MAVFERDDWWHKASWPRIAPSTRGDGRLPATRPAVTLAAWRHAGFERVPCVARKLNTGTAPVNTGDEFVPCISFAGARQSGYGRGRSPHAFDRYAQPTAWFRLR
ncbi:aldehyde dehydrogenase family protein [Zestomonas thermotolerans]|jgi:hypothetical protein|uniref:aldehyde dehydrogenase family protein n=1 Tax=Zestomonas thermotolerans TaxID=157784 RepID=UPI0038B63F41